MQSYTLKNNLIASFRVLDWGWSLTFLTEKGLRPGLSKGCAGLGTPDLEETTLDPENQYGLFSTAGSNVYSGYTAKTQSLKNSEVKLKSSTNH